MIIELARSVDPRCPESKTLTLRGEARLAKNCLKKMLRSSVGGDRRVKGVPS
jgi:hypothetical protein